MNEPKILITMKDIQRFKLITDALEKKLKGTQARELLGISYIHFLRLKKKVKSYGIQGLFRKSRPAHNKKIDRFSDTVAELYQKYYYDFNVMHFKEKLLVNHNINLSYESVRKILIVQDIHKPKKKKKVHRQRRRMPKSGMLVQMDSSEHNLAGSYQSKMVAYRND